MKNFLLILLLSAPPCALADTVNISGASRWSRTDSHTIIIYRGSKAICVVKTRAYIYSSSQIRFKGDTISNYDQIVIDGAAEDIREVKKL